MKEDSFRSDREECLDFLCANYYNLRLFCLDYDLVLPMSEDLGLIRNYLDANLSEILECAFGCHNPKKTKNVIKNYTKILKEKRQNYYAIHNKRCITYHNYGLFRDN